MKFCFYQRIGFLLSRLSIPSWTQCKEPCVCVLKSILQDIGTPLLSSFFNLCVVKQVFSNMEFLGWYTTGDRPTEADTRFHEQVSGRVT